MNLVKLLLLAAEAIPEQAPVSVPDTSSFPSYEGAFLKMFLVLIALIVGIFLTVWLLKKLAQGRFSGNKGKSIQVIERHPLSPKTMLYVIEFEGKQTLLAESQLEVKKLMESDVPLAEESE